MNIYITLDYELFFGSNSGSVDKCIIEPTNAILDIVNPHDIKIVCFIDAGYLIALERQKGEHPQLKIDYDKVTQQIKHLSDNGHGIELHVHPHWEDSYFDGENWAFDTSRYKLSDFNHKEVLDIITQYNNILKKITGKSPVAFRAGGWSAQPFINIKKALEINNIFIDSTVYPKGYYSSGNQVFDFRSIPEYKSSYKFSDDLTKEDLSGSFIEVPISSTKVSPFFFWKFALKKIFKQKRDLAFGNGKAVGMSKKELLRLMSSYSYSVVSIDGFKASLIKSSFKKYVTNTNNKGDFVLIGHPKAFTQYSLNKFSQFINYNKDKHQFTTYKSKG
ncbi:MAG: polysaccharide deacetylase family protein [Urechidicola sp.]|nr:polysaccharide deacetylase family protein [Urechidicola sp.]